jgi:phenylalanyl-tRNA synthetase beta chain
MTILTMNRRALEKRVGKITMELEKKITDMGTPIEDIKKDTIEIEVFPNRPDLLSLENFARALNQFNGKGKIANFNIHSPKKSFNVIIDKSVKEIRPFTACAIVKGLKLDDEQIRSLIELQEKLHGSIGRKRKKVAIGIYPLDKITLPIRFVGKKNEEVKFLPLEGDREMTPRQILTKHPTGKEYANLLKDTKVYPIFLDANNEVLSMPPIINSEKTGRIIAKTKNIFIECSGHNIIYLKKTLNILLASIAEMKGKIYAMNILDSVDGNYLTPEMNSEDLEFKIEDIEKTLGIKFSEKIIKNYFARMGIGFRKEKKRLIAEIPCYRADILHWIDLAEEVAIAHGFENFDPVIPDISTIAEENDEDKAKRVIGNILAGLGFLECSSYHLTTKKNIKKMHYDFNNFIEVEASKTERNVLRYDLMTNLLQIFSENSNAAYSQKIFELGRGFEKIDSGVIEKEKLAIAIAGEKMGWTEMKQTLDYLFKMLNKKYIVEDIEDSNYIIGRCGKIIVDGYDIGRCGEIAPRVLKNWKIRVPAVGFEVELERLINKDHRKL